MVILKLEDGCLGQVLVSYAVRRQPSLWSEFTVYGTEGAVEVKRNEIIVHAGGSSTSSSPMRITSQAGDGITEEIRQFVDCIIEDTPPPVSGEDALQSLAVVLAAYRSANEGVMVSI